MKTISRSGATWVSLLVVLGLLTVLVGMILPAFNVVRVSSHHDRCSNHQRQIVLAMGIYSNDNDQKWPYFPCDYSGRSLPLWPNLDPIATAIGSMEYVATLNGGDLPNKIFRCPQRSERMPTTPANAHIGAASPWAAAGPLAIGYSYDWSAPANTASVRVILADRDQTTHKSLVFVAFADGRVGNFSAKDGHFRNRDAANDDIYDDAGDGPMNVAEAGSATRAWVR